MKKINAIVFCQNNEHGKMEFYLRINNEYNLYLFTTNYYSKKSMLFTILAEEWKMHTARPLFFVSRNSTREFSAW